MVHLPHIPKVPPKSSSRAHARSTWFQDILDSFFMILYFSPPIFSPPILLSLLAPLLSCSPPRPSREEFPRTAHHLHPRPTVPPPYDHAPRTLSHLRPQNHENTVSRPICEVKHGIV